jgi:hypothetical protein
MKRKARFFPNWTQSLQVAFILQAQAAFPAHYSGQAEA